MKKAQYYKTGAVLAAGGLAASMAIAEEAQTVTTLTETAQSYRTVGLGLCAALNMSLSVIGAAYAVARIGSAAMGAAAEKPELLTRSILFVAVAEGLAVLGFVISIMLIQKL
jgi:V/A-type H+-transporting ATPase subunit K